MPIYVAATLVALVAPLVSLVLYLSIAGLYAVTSQGVAVPGAKGGVAGGAADGGGTV